jgi:uncharacterized membrane protein YbhN (UPF0104 family)
VGEVDVKPRARERLALAARVALVAALVVGGARSVDVAEVRAWIAALRSASLAPVVIGVFLSLFANSAARTARWRALLGGPRAPGGLLELATALLAGHAASTILPFRAGEIVRFESLRRTTRWAPSAILASQVIEKPIEALSLAVFALSLAGPRVAAPLGHTLLAALGGALVLVSLFVVGLRWSRTRALLAPIRGRVGAAALASAIAWSLVSDAVDAAMIVCAASSLGVALSPGEAAIVLVAANVAYAVPATPGQIGVLEMAVTWALARLGVPFDTAVPIAIVYHVLHVVPTTLAGAALGLATVWRARARGAVAGVSS